MKIISGFKLAGVALATTFALTGCGSDTYLVDTSVPAEPVVDTKIAVFTDALATTWASYSCCATERSTFPTDGDHGAVTAFSIDADTTVGYLTSAPLDISNITTTGTLDFDLKVVTAPTADGVTTGEAVPTSWVLKFESNGGAYAGGEEIEIVLNDLVVGTWKSISHPLNDLGTLDITKIDKVLIFPAWGDGAGSTYYVDNLVFNENGAASVPSAPPVDSAPSTPAAFSIDFEAEEQFPWGEFEGADALQFVANPASGSANSSATVAQASIPVSGQPWAGYFTDGLGTFTLDSSNSIIKMMVYKDTISPVGIKLQNGDEAVGEIQVSNTKTNEWEELAFDFSNKIDVSATDNITGFSVFMDFTERAADTTNYFDNITFTEQ